MQHLELVAAHADLDVCRVAIRWIIKNVKPRPENTVFRGSADRVGKQCAARPGERFREQPWRLYTAKAFCL